MYDMSRADSLGMLVTVFGIAVAAFLMLCLAYACRAVDSGDPWADELADFDPEYRESERSLAEHDRIPIRRTVAQVATIARGVAAVIVAPWPIVELAECEPLGHAPAALLETLFSPYSIPLADLLAEARRAVIPVRVPPSAPLQTAPPQTYIRYTPPNPDSVGRHRVRELIAA